MAILVTKEDHVLTKLLMANKKVFFLNHLKEKYTFFNKREGHKIDGLFWHLW